MSKTKLEQINWTERSTDLMIRINRFESWNLRNDLVKILYAACDIATKVSQVEVAERRTPGSLGRRSDELIKELEEKVSYLEHMILIATLKNT